MSELKKGQQVVIKSAKLSGTVISPRDADEGNEYYKVQIAEQTLWVDRNNLEPWPEPTAKPARWSKEWNSELTRFNELGKRCLAKPNDKELVRQLAESGEKLGFFIPIE